MRAIFSGSRFALKFGWNTTSKGNLSLRRFRLCASAMDAAATVGRVSNGGGVVRFPLSASSALFMQKGDITKWSIDGSTDAIVRNRSSLSTQRIESHVHRLILISSPAGKSC